MLAFSEWQQCSGRVGSKPFSDWVCRFVVVSFETLRKGGGWFRGPKSTSCRGDKLTKAEKRGFHTLKLVEISAILFVIRRLYDWDWRTNMSAINREMTHIHDIDRKNGNFMTHTMETGFDTPYAVGQFRIRAECPFTWHRSNPPVDIAPQPAATVVPPGRCRWCRPASSKNSPLPLWSFSVPSSRRCRTRNTPNWV
jgi:hypothetical protein